MQTFTPNNVVNFRHFDYAKPKYLQPNRSRRIAVAFSLGLMVAALIIKISA